MYKLLQRKNAALKEEMTLFLRELVATPSLSCQEGRVAQLVGDKLRDFGLDDVTQDTAGNVIGFRAGRKGDKTLVLLTHMDTVGGDESATRDHLPGSIQNDKLYGVGASDCKSGIASQLFSMQLLKRSLLPIDGNLVFACTVAEENGCSLGVRELMEHTLPDMDLNPDYVILGEPTDLGLYYGHDGWVEAGIEIVGSNPFQVRDVGNTIFNEIDALYSTASKKIISLERPRYAENNGFLTGSIRLNRRLGVGENLEHVLRELKHEAQLAAQTMGSISVTTGLSVENQCMYTGKKIKVEKSVRPWAIDPYSPLIERSRQALQAGACRVRCGKWELRKLCMGTAGAILVNEFNIPTIGYGPGNEFQAHSADEWVELENVYEASYGTAVIAHGLIGVPVYGWTSDEI